MEKQRLKLYKSKKLWVTAAVGFAVMMVPQLRQPLAADTQPAAQKVVASESKPEHQPAADQSDETSVAPEPEMLVPEAEKITATSAENAKKEQPEASPAVLAPPAGQHTSVPAPKSQFVKYGDHEMYYYDSDGKVQKRYNSENMIVLEGRARVMEADGKILRNQSVQTTLVAYKSGGTDCTTSNPTLRRDSRGQLIPITAYVGDEGIVITGQQYVDFNDGKTYHANFDGSKTTNYEDSRYKEKGIYYFGADGELVRNAYYTVADKQYYADADGKRVTDPAKIPAHVAPAEKAPTGPETALPAPAAPEAQSRTFATLANGKTVYYDVDHQLAKNRYFEAPNSGWYYAAEDGQIVTGHQIIDGLDRYFKDDGRQFKKEWLNVNGDCYYFDEQGTMLKETWYDERYFDATGRQIKGRTANINGDTYRFTVDSGQLVKGFVDDGAGGVVYFDEKDGRQAKQCFVWRDSHKYYFDANGKQLCDQTTTIEGQTYHFDKTGAVLTNTRVQAADGTWRFFGQDGHQLANRFGFSDGKAYYFDANGQQFSGSTCQINGQDYHFADDGHVTLTSCLLQDGDKKVICFDAQGQATDRRRRYDSDRSTAVGLLKNQRVQLNVGDFYVDADGKVVQGFYTDAANGKTYYASSFGTIVSSRHWQVGDASYVFECDGALLTCSYYAYDGEWRYADDKGRMVTGLQQIGKHLQFFDAQGNQVKNQVITDPATQQRYFLQPNTGNVTTDDYVKAANGNWYYAGADGVLVTGEQTIRGQKRYFEADGRQVKNQFKTSAGSLLWYDAEGAAIIAVPVTDADNMYTAAGSILACDPKTMTLVTSAFRQKHNGAFVYFGADGKQIVNQFKNIDGQLLYFDEKGEQVKGRTLTINGVTCTFDAHSGALAGGHLFTNSDGTQGYTDNNGQQAKNTVVLVGDRRYYVNADGKTVANQLVRVPTTAYPGFEQYWVTGDGTVARNQFVFPTDTSMYYVGDDGTVLRGPARSGFMTIADKRYFAEGDGRILRNSNFSYYWSTYHADDKGQVTLNK